MKVARIVLVTDIAGREPAVLHRRRGRIGMAVITEHYVGTAHQDFAVCGDCDFDSGEWLAD
jgi:hypothetical protein